MHVDVSRAAPTAGYRSWRVTAVALLGPLTALAGVVWAAAQPYRLVFLHPSDHGVWGLVAEPPALVVLVGLLFAFVVAGPLLADLGTTTYAEG